MPSSSSLSSWAVPSFLHPPWKWSALARLKHQDTFQLCDLDIQPRAAIQSYEIHSRHWERQKPLGLPCHSGFYHCKHSKRLNASIWARISFLASVSVLLGATRGIEWTCKNRAMSAKRRKKNKWIQVPCILKTKSQTKQTKEERWAMY